MSKGGVCEADLRRQGIVESSSAGTYSSIEKVLTLPHERVVTHVTAYLEGGLPRDRRPLSTNSHHRLIEQYPSFSRMCDDSRQFHVKAGCHEVVHP
jgi:hypothetical protein